MARDRNVTVWQAYVTVMSIVSFLCLGALAYMMFTSGTNFQVAQAAIKEKNDATASMRKVSEQNQLLQSILGVGKPISESEFTQLASSVSGDAEIDAAVKAYTNHMGLFGPNEPEKNYSKLVDTLMQELRARNIQVANAASKAVQDTENYNRKIEAETALREEAQKEKDRISLQMEKDLADYTAKIAEQVKMNADLEQEKKKQFDAFRKQLGEVNGQLAEANKRNEDQIRRIDTLVQKINEVQNESFQYVQGEITEVVSRSGGQDEVWINLGRSDGLRPGVSFVVVDADTTQATLAKKKATIEVLEVISGTPHLSRAKVIADRGYTAVLRGDKVYSPFWQPGSSVQIALVGKMDIDGDGRDDRDRLKSLIAQNGCEIAMDMLPSGETTGRLTEQVRWLVMGDDLKYRTDESGQLDPSVAAASKRRRELELQARSLGITIISPINLMNWLRVGTDASPLGDAARPSVSEFRTRPATSGGRVSSLYQERDGRAVPNPSRD